jgi:hypothetical protein
LIAKLDRQTEDMGEIREALRKTRGERDQFKNQRDQLDKDLITVEFHSKELEIAESYLQKLLGGVPRAKDDPVAKEAKKHFDEIASHDKVVVFLDLKDVSELQIKGAAEKWWSKAEKKPKTIEARDPVDKPNNVVPRDPICSIEHYKSNEGLPVLELRWHTIGDKKVHLRELLYRSVLTVKAADGKAAYVCFWQPQRKQPPGLKRKDVFCVLSPTRENRNDSKIADVMYYMEIDGIRVKLLDAKMDPVAMDPGIAVIRSLH